MDVATIDRLLTTTRSVRRRLDCSRPVEVEVIEDCLEIAAQAPSSSNHQRWHFVVVTDAGMRRAIAEVYRRAFTLYSGRSPTEGSDQSSRLTPLQSSARHLADHLHEVPAMVLFCYEHRVEQEPPIAQASLYGSIFPAVWSFMLALRARGLGSVITTLHLRYEEDVASILGLPANLTQAALLPVAYTVGTSFSPAPRRSVRECIHWNGWD